ncbi:MAG: DUF2007 domain-containing protein [Oscillospiraceae bacterium]|nr:DUF2007 domain-containing protein [Oscillospiraceae bacterium]
MLTVLNRTELLLTQSGEHFQAVQSALKSAGIDYAVKLWDPNFQSYDQATLGALGKPAAPEYVIYVNKKDADQARRVLSQVRAQRDAQGK